MPSSVWCLSPRLRPATSSSMALRLVAARLVLGDELEGSIGMPWRGVSIACEAALRRLRADALLTAPAASGQAPIGLLFRAGHATLLPRSPITSHMNGHVTPRGWRRHALVDRGGRARCCAARVVLRPFAGARRRRRDCRVGRGDRPGAWRAGGHRCGDGGRRRAVEAAVAARNRDNAREAEAFARAGWKMVADAAARPAADGARPGAARRARARAARADGLDGGGARAGAAAGADRARGARAGHARGGGRGARAHRHARGAGRAAGAVGRRCRRTTTRGGRSCRCCAPTALDDGLAAQLAAQLDGADADDGGEAAARLHAGAGRAARRHEAARRRGVAGGEAAHRSTWPRWRSADRGKRYEGLDDERRLLLVGAGGGAGRGDGDDGAGAGARRRSPAAAVDADRRRAAADLVLPPTWKCVHADGSACTAAELTNPWYKQVFLTSAGFAEAERDDFWSRVRPHRRHDDRRRRGQRLERAEEAIGCSSSATSSPGGALGAPDAAFGAQSRAPDSRLRHVAVAGGGLRQDRADRAGERCRGLQPFTAGVLFNTFQTPVTANAAPPSFVQKAFGVAKFTRADLNERGSYITTHELAHAGLNYLDEYVESGFEELNIRSIDVLTPLALFDWTWGGFVNAISDLARRLRLQHQRDPRRQRQRQHRARRWPTTVSTPGWGSDVLRVGRRHVLRPRHLPHERQQPDERQPRRARRRRRLRLRALGRRSSA